MCYQLYIERVFKHIQIQLEQIRQFSNKQNTCIHKIQFSNIIIWKTLSKMSAGTFFANQQTDQQYFVPLEYKIVDLPVIQIKPMQTIKVYSCKIYRKVDQANLDDPGLETSLWKRKCYGRVKFVRVDGYIVVAAFEHGTCHNRLKQIPYTCQQYYNLVQSQQYEFNWVYQSQLQGTISFALSENDYYQFRDQWQKAKEFNKQAKELQWLNLISEGVFD